MRCAISVADIHVSFHGDSADAPMLDERYGPFLIDSLLDGEARIELALHEVPQDLGTDAELLVTRDGEHFTLTGPDLSCEILVDGTHAQLRAPRLERYVDAILRYVLARRLLARGGLLLHASAVVIDREAWIFAGPSGVGKTTISQNLPGRTLGDEAVAVTVEDGRLMCHSTPYWRALPDAAPVAAIVFPSHGSANEWTELSPARGLGKLMSCIGPLLPGTEKQVMLAAQDIVSTGTARLVDVSLESIQAIEEWLHPKIAGLPAAEGLVE